MKQYSLADIKSLQERQQAAHRGRSIYSDMRSISEEAFRNALELDAMPIIKRLLEVVQRHHEVLKEVRGDGHQIADDAFSLAEPFIEKDKHQARLNERRNNEQRSR